jgi:hypothetical protein
MLIFQPFISIFIYELTFKLIDLLILDCKSKYYDEATGENRKKWRLLRN